MTRYEPTEVEATDLPTGVHYLGVDANGEQHFTTSAVGGPTIYVTCGAGFQRYDVTEHTVADWIANVRTKLGEWQHLNYESNVGDNCQTAREEAV